MTSGITYEESLKARDTEYGNASVENMGKKQLMAPAKAADGVMGLISDTWVGLKATTSDLVGAAESKIRGKFNSLNFEEESQRAYGNRASIVSTFAQEFQAKQMTPETMRNMELLSRSGALDGTAEGLDANSARISKSYLDMVKQAPDMYGLTPSKPLTYEGGAFPMFSVAKPG